MIAWHWVVHVLGIDYGLPFGHWGWYNLWSGVAGSCLVNATLFFFLFYIHHTCHYSRWCLRWGHHPLAGGMYKVCGRHHPDHEDGKRPRGQALWVRHREWEARQS